MDIWMIDYWANQRWSVVHRASALPKMVGAAMIVLAAALSFDPVALAGSFGLIAVPLRDWYTPSASSHAGEAKGRNGEKAKGLPG